MKFYPTTKYNIETSLNSDQICKRLLDKYDPSNFDVGIVSDNPNKIIFDATFYNAIPVYGHGPIDDYWHPKLTGTLVPKIDYTEVQVLVELGYNQKIIFGVVLGFFSLILLLNIIGSIFWESIGPAAPSLLIAIPFGLICLVYAIMIGYVKYTATGSKLGFSKMFESK